MMCPNCGKKIKKVEFDNQNILHCANCGCTFFEQNGINRISLKSARTLAWDKKESFIKGSELACPKDSSIMISVQNEDAIPVDVTLLRCPSCYGVFAHPEDLLKFKQAQNIKIRFFKIWSKPLPSLQTILVLSFVGFLILTVAASVLNLNNSQVSTTSAQDQISNVYAKQTSTFLFISFNTKVAYRTSIKLRDVQTGEIVTKQVSSNFNTLHTLTLEGINTQHPIYYQILLEDKNGDKITTEEKVLKIQ